MNKTKAIVFFGIVSVGLVVSVITLNNLGKPVEAPVIKKETKNVSSVPAPTKVTKPASNQPTVPTKVAAPAEKVGKGVLSDPKSKSSPKALMSALSKGIAAKDYNGFVDAVGEKAIPKAIRPRLKALIENPDLVLDEKQPYSEISKSVEGLRWAINLVPSTGNASAAQIYTDIKKTDTSMFDVIKIGFPIDLTASVPELVKKGEIENPDAVTIAHAFAKAVVAKKFKTARALADQKNVTDERVTALMIAIEEGRFSLKKERPLVVTLARDEITWVLTRLDSDSQSSEFALELGKVGEGWKVNGLTFSKIIASLANRAGGGDVAYSPFVKDPAGGDSLVLYFEFDNLGVTSRTDRQLGVVAGILKGDRSKKIIISGHADALGSDDYNSKLSDGRAASIRESLVSQGANPEQIITKAFGETKPRSPNFNSDGTDNPRGRSENRRAEVYLDF